MTLTLLQNADLNDINLAEGYYYVDNTCTGFPPRVTAGRLIISKATIGTDVHFVKQELEGIQEWGDKVLSKYERYAFPFSQNVSGAYEDKWMKLRPNMYIEDQPQPS